ncbi:nascent polypeptide-associated complex alpha chain, putative [Eimeria maxima]|uniref:Nascent polypeptide-associated complex alpha chain, putative n=1 Tax=Eimeria maxima TaxID=5804 RepID=U6LWJ3_EIMMA|nr:nascent polypeptide-associated complex alpha chain, putative [Eimeria maxima]CDJ56096.1 nascent polypeptide-associated complex alpha chain, putative [Eimeria maxima]
MVHKKSVGRKNVSADEEAVAQSAAATAAAAEAEKDNNINNISSSSSDSGTDDEEEHKNKEEIQKEEEQQVEFSPSKYRQSRNERKARKAVLKLGLKQVPDVVRVILRKSKQAWYIISKPDVFKSLTSDTYIIFGQAEKAAQRFTQDMMGSLSTSAGGRDDLGVTGGGGGGGEGGEEGEGGGEGGGEEEEEEAEGLDKKDIDLIVQQIKCTRKEAIDALRKNGNDIVEAILQLTS